MVLTASPSRPTSVSVEVTATRSRTGVSPRASGSCATRCAVAVTRSSGRSPSRTNHEPAVPTTTSAPANTASSTSSSRRTVCSAGASGSPVTTATPVSSRALSARYRPSGADSDTVCGPLSALRARFANRWASVARAALATEPSVRSTTLSVPSGCPRTSGAPSGPSRNGRPRASASCWSTCCSRLERSACTVTTPTTASTRATRTTRPMDSRRRRLISVIDRGSRARKLVGGELGRVAGEGEPGRASEGPGRVGGELGRANEGPVPAGVTSPALTGSRRRLEHVPDPPHGVQQRLATTVDLLAEVPNVQLDDVALTTEVVVPDPVEDLGLAQYPARVAHQVPQQFELRRRQLDQLPTAAYLAGLLVQGQVQHAQLAVLMHFGQAHPAQQGAQPGNQLLQAERLGDVVVATDGQPGDPVLGAVARGEEDHRSVDALGPQPAQHLEAVEVRQHYVEHDQVGPEGASLA